MLARPQPTRSNPPADRQDPAKLLHHIAVSPGEAATLTGTSRGFIHKLIRTGQLKSQLIGTRRLILVDDLKNLVAGERADYARQRVEETCAAQGIDVIADEATRDAAAAILASADNRKQVTSDEAA